jgi:hypothetical protein
MRYHIGRVFSEPDVTDLAASRIKTWLGMPRETVLSFCDRDPEMDIRPLLARSRCRHSWFTATQEFCDVLRRFVRTGAL